MNDLNPAPVAVERFPLWEYAIVLRDYTSLNCQIGCSCQMLVDTHIVTVLLYRMPVSFLSETQTTTVVNGDE